jgi:hypothetical protein
MIELAASNAVFTRYADTDGYLDLAIVGSMTEREVAHFRDDALLEMRERKLLGMIIDLREANLLVGDLAVRPISGAIESETSLRRRPIAVVVRPELQAFYLAWAWEMVNAGLARGVFLKRREAQTWVRSVKWRREAPEKMAVEISV